MNILVAGDMVPRDRVASLFNEGKYEDVLGGVKELISKQDLSIVNLEAPIIVSSESVPIEKSGPHLCSNLSVIEALKFCGFNIITLANNHIRDYGDVGVSDTIFNLNREKILTVGAGLDINEAISSIFVSLEVAIINCCEHEFSIAGKAKAGANPLNPITIFRKIQEVKETAKYVLLIVHGGTEHYNLPTPRMKELYRFFIDSGADVIINHHQHCFSGYEVYNGKVIFYGLGNFCFDGNNKRSSPWNFGYMVKLSVGNVINFEIFPYRQCDDKPEVRLLSEFEKEEFQVALNNLNRIICDDRLLNESFKSYCESKYNSMKVHLSPYNNSLLRSLCLKHFIPSFNSKKRNLRLYNLICCEAHRDILTDYLSNF